MRIIEADRLKRLVDQEWFDCQEKVSFFDEIDRTPTVEEIYGFKIDHLALIAKIMLKEGVDPRDVISDFTDAGRIARMIIEDQIDYMKRMLEEWKKAISEINLLPDTKC